MRQGLEYRGDVVVEAVGFAIFVCCGGDWCGVCNGFEGWCDMRVDPEWPEGVVEVEDD